MFKKLTAKIQLFTIGIGIRATFLFFLTTKKIFYSFISAKITNFASWKKLNIDI